MSNAINKDCFVVMPFGIKYVTEIRENPQPAAPDAPPSEPVIKTTAVDFDTIYHTIIKPAVADAKLMCTRSDELSQAGNIQREMISRIIKADVVIVDITSQNANVFYELGIRHSFRRTTTVVIHRAGTHIPFNINGMRSVEYNERSEAEQQASRQRITKAIQTSFQGKDVDSLIYTLFSDITVSRYAEPIMERVKVSWRLGLGSANPTSREIGYITGNIAHIKDVDAWVNAENTQLELGRMHEDSVSAIIRYYGAKRNSAGYVEDDLIRRALEQRKGDFWNVEPGMVITTPPGQLGASNNVKAILHVAALHGEPGRGYLPVRDHPGCVTRALQEVEYLNMQGMERLDLTPECRPQRRSWFRREPQKPQTAKRDKIEIKSVLIPLFGTRSGNLFPQDVADRLFRAAVVFFEMHPDTVLERIYFLAWTTDDKLICDAAIGSLERANKTLTKVEPVPADAVPRSAAATPTVPANGLQLWQPPP